MVVVFTGPPQAEQAADKPSVLRTTVETFAGATGAREAGWGGPCHWGGIWVSCFRQSRASSPPRKAEARPQSIGPNIQTRNKGNKKPHIPDFPKKPKKKMAKKIQKGKKKGFLR